MPKISVIIPVYKVEKYLNRCVDSVLNQDFEDFELILVDDGSPDNSGKICDEYAKMDSRVKVIHKENGGLSDARNAGIEIARGDYLNFIDSDDWVELDYLSILYNNAKKYDADISVVNLHKEYDNRREKSENVKTGLFESNDIMSMLYDKEMSIYLNVACAKLYRRKLFLTHRYPVGKLHEDGFTTYKLFQEANKIYLSDADLYFYYQREGSIMNNSFSTNRIDEYFVYRERAKYFKDIGNEKAFSKNEKIKLACILTLTIKLLKSDVKRTEVRKYLKIFKEDVRNSKKKLLAEAGKKQKIAVSLYSLSPRLFFLFNKLLKAYRKEKAKRREKAVMKALKKDVRLAKKRNGENYAFLAMTAKGGNLGDHALCIATKSLLKDTSFVELPCVDMPIYFDNLDKIKQIIGDKPIVLNAGGNLGTLWFNEAEIYLRRILQEFPNNKIIILPNTCYYEKSQWGNFEFEKSKGIYNNHKSLDIYVREPISYELIKDAYKNVYLMPDMVMYLNNKLPIFERNGCLLCLRNDTERTMSKEDEEKTLGILSKHFDTVTLTDTVVPRNVCAGDREEEVYAKLNEMRKSKLVVTDRLHGMVFSAIAETPCIVLKSKSHKLKGCYQWISNLDYIRFVDNIEELDKAIKDLVDKQCKYDNSHLLKHFEGLREKVYSTMRSRS